jgi:hypothetical protein
MTRKVEGPPQRTPAEPCGSTEQQSAAVSARDECVEQLRRIAEDAQNFKIRLFHAPEDSAVREWTAYSERRTVWMRESADSIRTYIDSLREILLDIGDLATEAKKNWPLFKAHIDNLFATIREIHEQAGTGAASHDDEAKRMDPLDVKRAIENRMAWCESEINRALKRALNSAKVWFEQQQNQRVRTGAVGESEASSSAPCPEVKTPESRPAKKRGPTADMDLHRAIARIVAPYGSNWKNESNLEKIAEHLDKNPLTPPSKQWAKREPAARSWRRAVSRWPALVVDRIAYSLRMASRNPR